MTNASKKGWFGFQADCAINEWWEKCTLVRRHGDFEDIITTGRGGSVSPWTEWVKNKKDSFCSRSDGIILLSLCFKNSVKISEWTRNENSIKSPISFDDYFLLRRHTVTDCRRRAENRCGVVENLLILVSRFLLSLNVIYRDRFYSHCVLVWGFGAGKTTSQ